MNSNINLHSLMTFREKIGESLNRILIHKGTSKERLISERAEIHYESSTTMPTKHAKDMWEFVVKNVKMIDSIDDETASEVIDKINKTHFEIKEYLINT